MRIMYDGIDADTVPFGASIYAGYTGGKWPSLAALRKKFAGKLFLSIAVSASDDAHALDIESGDATPAQAPTWANRQRVKGNPYPVCYMNASTWPAVRAAFIAQQVPEPLYWVAEYVKDPSKIPAIPSGAIALQYYSYSGYDISIVEDYFPGLDPEPVPQTREEEEDMSAVTAQSGRAGLGWAKGTKHVVQLTWDADAVTNPVFQVKGCTDTKTVVLSSKLSGSGGKVVLELGASTASLSGVVVYGPAALQFELYAV